MSVENKKTDMTETEKKEFRYDAFISYRHAPLDIYVAETLHKKLENFKVPRVADKETKKLLKSGIKRIFRDRDELPLSGNLSDPITEALASSEYLIVICSPRIVESLWCQREIETFIKLRGVEYIFAVLIEGEPEESFPKQLCAITKEVINEEGVAEVKEIPLEPLAADVRGKDKAQIKKKMKTEVLRLVAPMIGCSYDDLKQRHKVQRMRRLLTTAAVIGSACFAFGAFSTFQALRIKKQSEQIAAQSEEILQQSEEIKKQAQSLLVFQTQSLSEQALSVYERGDRTEALLLAMEGAPKELDNPDRPVVADTERALGEILQVYANGNDYKPYFLFEHDTITISSALNASGTRLVTMDEMKQIYTWDTESGELLAKVTNPVVGNLDYGPMYLDDERILCSGIGGAVIMNVEDLSVQLYISSDHIFECAVSEDGSRFALGVYDEKVQIYESDGTLLGEFYDDSVDLILGRNMTFSPDGTRLLFAGEGSREQKAIAYMIDALTGERIWSCELGYDIVDDMLCTQEYEAYISTMNYLEIEEDGVSVDEAVSYYDANGVLQWERTDLNMHEPLAAYGQDAVLVPGYDVLYMLSREDGRCIKEINYAADIIKCVGIAESNLVGVTLDDGTIQYDLIDDYDYTFTYMEPAKERMLYVGRNRDIIIRQPYRSNQVLLYKNAVGSQAVVESGEEGLPHSPVSGQFINDHTLLLSDMLREICAYDIEQKKVLYECFFDEYIHAILGYDGGFVVLCTESIRNYDAVSGKEINMIETEYIDDFDIVGEQLYILDVGGGLYIYDIPSLEQVYSNDTFGADSLIVSSDGKYIVGETYQEDICLNVETNEITWFDRKSNVLAVTSDRSMYLSADVLHMTVGIYEFGNDVALKTMECQTAYIENAVFSPDGTKLCVSYVDGRVELYDAENFTLLQKYYDCDDLSGWYDVQSSDYTMLRYGVAMTQMLNKEAEIVYEIPGYITMSPDETRIYSVSKNVLYSYPVYNLEMLISEALTVLGDRQLTQQERQLYHLD